jgi:hypothetical protein
MSTPYPDHRLMNTITTRPATREEKIVNPGVYEVSVQEPEKRECMNCAAFGECHPNNDAGRCGYEPPAAQRPWVGLSEEEIDKLKHLIDWTATWSHGRFAYEIEQLLKIKNT